MRTPCYFHHVIPDSRCSMWRFGSITDRHSACPPDAAVVVGLENELYVPEDCGSVEVYDSGNAATACQLLVKAEALGYRLRFRRTPLGEPWTELETQVEPFVIRQDSLLTLTPESPIYDLLDGSGKVYEGDDGELWVQDTEGAWFHFLDERLLAVLRGEGS